MSRELPLTALGCSLDAAAASRQGERWDAIVRSVRATERGPTDLSVELGPEVDERLLLEAIEVERECCPFFTIDWVPRERLLRFEVGRREHAPALDAVADVLTPG